MNYAQFRDYLARFLWRDGDATFEADLDNIILMGEARLNRDLRVDEMVVTKVSDLILPTLEVPHDFLEMRSITTGDGGVLGYISPHDMERRQLSHAHCMVPYYTKKGKYLHFHGPMTVERPVPVVMSYYAAVPDFQSTDESWLADRYSDVYVYAVLRHTGMYLKDDQRVAIWNAEYLEAVTSANNADMRQRYAGSPLISSLPGVVA